MTGPSSVVWVSPDEVAEAHSLIVGETGGLDGVLNSGALEAALWRGYNRVQYAETPPSVPEIAALMAIGVAKSHAFVDGNKRSGLFAMNLFLERNGFVLPVDPWEMERTILELVRGDMSEPQYIFWVEAHVQEIDDFFNPIEDMDSD